MKYCILDTESTGAQRPSKGSALDPRNRLCYVGTILDGVAAVHAIEYSMDTPFGATLSSLAALLGSADLLVLFNAKHDLHWLRRYGLPIPRAIWDCQLAEFIIHGQTEPFPNLDDTSRRYGAAGKKEEVETNYYDKGIDTDGVPEEVLVDYLHQDLRCTEQTFLGQIAALQDRPLLKRLIWESCQDLIVTEDMEWNGLRFHIPGLIAQAEKLEAHIIAIDKELHTYVLDSRINWDSPAQVSAVLYGGEIVFSHSEPYRFYYKDSKKEPVTKMRRVEETLRLPRIVEPLPRSELKSGGFSTEDKTLRKLKTTAAAKNVVALILDRRTTQTQIDRYFRGIPKKYVEMGWQNNIVHGQLHHVVAATGRLSSSNPNVQNIDERARSCLMTRFGI